MYLPGGGHCFYKNKSVSGAVLDIDNVESYGPEHIATMRAAPGDYRLSVVYYARKPAGAPLRPVAWRVFVRLKGRPIETYSGTLSREGQEQTIVIFRWPDPRMHEEREIAQ